MSNFKNLLDDILLEQHKSFHELEENGVIGKGTYYEFATYSPYLKTIIDIANYLRVSLDYLANRVTENHFKVYKYPQPNIIRNIVNIMKNHKVSQRQLERDTDISRTNFVYWNRGSVPKFETLITLADYFKCNIDDFLDFE